MEKEGKYIYCIVNTEQERFFGPIGTGSRSDEVSTIGYGDLAMVVSNHPTDKFVVNKENMLAHERVIEEVMKEFDSVLPVRFGTIASNADEIRNLLDRRSRELTTLLRNMEHKVELGVKGLWRNMDVIFEEILKENKHIKKAKQRIEKANDKDNVQARENVGIMVHDALLKKKETQAEELVNVLRRAAKEYKLNKTSGDEMFMNAAFLVDKGREKEFDNIMADLDQKYQRRIKFLYTGPVPLFNFVNIVIYPEEWEK